METETNITENVIEVKDVSMIYKVMTGGYSGLKDYLIQTIKKEINYRMLHALDHVSFEVKKGEVVGVIGPNGAGKSTLLKIISGAVKPTEGEVKADRNKLQILTYGTGFDNELTGRENVFLNGAICGYSKEFLERNYQQIVNFAELSGFMDEKVKNYSSGMRARLGFAIAQAGGAAEIMILDEALAVGDEAFHRKSMARLKEMLHGGSTVLMVSHSLGNIKDNCSRAIWLDHGRVVMDGEAKMVCNEYHKSNVKE